MSYAAAGSPTSMTGGHGESPGLTGPMGVSALEGAIAPTGRRSRVLQGLGRTAWAGRVATVVLRWRVAGLLLAHGLLFAAVFPLAYLVRFDGAVPPEYLLQMTAALPTVVGLKLLIFLATGGHRGWWRYTSFADMTVLAETAALSTAVLAAVGISHAGGPPAPRSILLLDGAATLLVLGAIRAGTRVVRERYAPMISARPCTRVFVVGADEAGVAVAQQVRRQPHLGMKVVGFLDDARPTQGRTAAGIEVIGPTGELGRHCHRHRVGAVLIPTPAVPSAAVRVLAAACAAAGVRAQVVPTIDDIIRGTMTARPRDVAIADLLAREPVRLDGESIGRLVRGRAVLVTGAAGSIGSEICRQVLAFAPDALILLDHSENGLFFLEKELRESARGVEVVAAVASITDPTRLRSVFGRHRPAVVFHAAAHKHVPMMEANPGEAVKNNVLGTGNLADEAVRAGVETFVLISTDKAVNPTSVMGACKRLGELYCRSLSGRSATKLVAVRFGNVLGSNGSVVPIFQEQIRNGEPVTVTHPEMTRYFMTIPEAAQLVLQAGALARGGEIFMLDMGEPIRIVDLARSMVRLSGLDLGRGAEIVFTGLRPGEKLHEELYGQGEDHHPTAHPKVFAVRQRSDADRPARADLDALARAAEGTPDEVRRALAALVPEYRPQAGVAAAAAAAPASAAAVPTTATASGRLVAPPLCPAAIG